MLITLTLIALHSVDGAVINVNPEMVTTTRVSKADTDKNKLLVNEVRCVIGLADGKFISVVETCEVVKQLLEGSR